MTLKFPNTRLFIHDLLVRSGLSVPEAIARAASEFGVIDPSYVKEIQIMDGDNRCQCMSIARNVVDKYFESKSGNPNVPIVDTSEVWSAIERDAEAYQQASNRDPEKCDTSNKSHDCTRFAPAVFDLVLQQIRRYP